MNRKRLGATRLAVVAAGWITGAPGVASETTPFRTTLDAGRVALDRGDAAAALVKASLALHLARGAGDRAGEAEALLHLGAVHRRLRRHADARAAFAEASRIERSAGNPVGEAAGALGQALVDRDLGDAALAIRGAQRSFETFRAAADPRKSAEALLLRGACELDLGFPSRAERTFEDAARLFLALADLRGQADAANGRGVALRRLGRTAEAAASLDGAGALSRRAGDPQGEDLAIHNAATVLADAGDLAGAAERYRAAADRFRAAGNASGRAAALVGLGTTLHASGDLDAADQVYAEAASLPAAPGDAGLTDTLRVDRAALARDRGRPGDGLPWLEDALAGARGRRDRSLEARCLLGLGAVYGDLGDTGRAARALAEAVRLAADEVAPDVSWRALTELGRLDLANGRLDQGIVHLGDAVDALERLRRGLGPLAGGDGRGRPGHLRGPYEALASALLRRGDSIGALLVAERMAAAEVREALGAGDGQGDPLARYAALAGRERAIAEQLREARGPTPDDVDPERARALEAELGRARVEFSAFVDGLRAEHRDLAALVRADPDDLQANQRALPAGVAVLEPLLLGDRLVVLVFTRDRLAFAEPEVAASEVEQAVSRALRLMRGGRPEDAARLEETLARLGSWLIEPVEAHLAGVATLLVCPGGSLRHLPFAALKVGGAWVAERYGVAMLTHAGALSGGEGQPLRLGAGDVLALGNPDGTLPSAEEEVRDLARRFPGTRTLLGPAATREALVREAPGTTVVHLATHGVLDPRDPPASHIVLAGDGEGGRLSYREIPGLATALSTVRLAVLSACETGVGVRAEGGEGGSVAEIAGLAWQFRRAGAPSLLASLWKVSDEGTRALMEAFYAEIQAGAGRALALRRAQQRLIADPRFAHPFHWAAFVLVGQWG